MKKSIFSLATALLLTMGIASAANAAVIGAPAAGAATFVLNFDEVGSGSYQIYNAGSGTYGPVVPDQGLSCPLSTGCATPVAHGYLTYKLPGAVNPGDVKIFELGTNMVGDGLRFFQDAATRNYYMQFYSLSTDVPHLPADTGIPPGFCPAAGSCANGPTEGVDESFEYVARDRTALNTNFYYGISAPGPTPGAGLAGLAFLLITGAMARLRGFSVR